MPGPLWPTCVEHRRPFGPLIGSTFELPISAWHRSESLYLFLPLLREIGPHFTQLDGSSCCQYRKVRVERSSWSWVLATFSNPALTRKFYKRNCRVPSAAKNKIPNKNDLNNWDWFHLCMKKISMGDPRVNPETQWQQGCRWILWPLSWTCVKGLKQFHASYLHMMLSKSSIRGETITSHQSSGNSVIPWPGWGHITHPCYGNRGGWEREYPAFPASVVVWGVLPTRKKGDGSRYQACSNEDPIWLTHSVINALLVYQLSGESPSEPSSKSLKGRLKKL